MATKKARKAVEIEAANDTFEVLAREWYASRITSWDAGTAKRVMGALERHVFPRIRPAPVHRHPLDGMDGTATRDGEARHLGTDDPGSVILKNLYDLARVTGRAINNPLEGVHKFLSTGKAENYAHVSADELPALLRAIRSYPHARDVQLGLHLLSLL